MRLAMSCSFTSPCHSGWHLTNAKLLEDGADRTSGPYLDVPMDDMMLVQVLQPLQHLLHDGRNGWLGQALQTISLHQHLAVPQ